jgi:GT2 family glycosyltransferase
MITPYCFFVPGAIIGANMAVARRVLKVIGGFDPLLGPGTGLVAEDVDFLARACWNGWKGRYDPAPVVAHHHRRKPGRDLATVHYSYAYGRGAYYIKWILNPASRGVYLREWYTRIRRRLAAHDRASVKCEIVGAMRYLARRARSTESITRF